MQHRWVPLVVGALLTLTACTGGTDDRAQDRPGRQAEAPRLDVPSALDDRTDDAFAKPLIPLDEILSGGPQPDGIPPIDDPTFESAGEVDWLEDNEPVLSLTVGGETRAYPLRVMTWHEIVNDVVGGVPVAVTYCPLCNSGVAFERTVGDRGVFSFGTSGLLYADNLVMYDRQTESLWPQLTGQASVGHLTGTQLEAIPMGTVSWSEFRRAEPTAKVLTQDTGFDRPYGTNPYSGYDEPNGELLFGLPDDLDTRLPVKERVIGLVGGSDSAAVLRSSLVGRDPRQVTVGGQDVVLWHRPGQASALDADTIAGGADIGTVGVFTPVADGRTLSFSASGDGFTDRETGSTWNVLGRATAGPLQGTELEAYRHLDTFWFAWATFHLDTLLLD
ncbi:MAG: DUF3179 domain-containing protein [Aeromicrobium sp.]|uniref:DUF3179 domain-containing protein n=1 Tax=Aeromicrobium sp. TaxID=1871063 RepID=UPI003C41B4E2